MTFEHFFSTNKCESDKGSTHDYINKWYSPEFTPRKDEKLTIVEIGIYRGDFVKLLTKWFINSRIVGIDPLVEISYNSTSFTTKEELSNNAGIDFIFEDGYSESVINKFEDNSIDYLIDDGPHTVESQLECISKWYSKIKNGGTMVIEDVQNIDGDKHKFDALAENMGIKYELVDLRGGANRKFDDVLLIFRK